MNHHLRVYGELEQALASNIDDFGWDAFVEGADVALRWVLGDENAEATLRRHMQRPSADRRRDWIAAGGDPTAWPEHGTPSRQSPPPDWPEFVPVPREPTAEECRDHAAIPYQVGDEARAAYACWYPQMGGYAGKAVAVPDPDGCVDVYVWHDGKFPFSRVWRRPTRLHHCDPDQFIELGRFLAWAGDQLPPAPQARP